MVVATKMMTDTGPKPVPALGICDVNVTLPHGSSRDVTRDRVEVGDFSLATCLAGLNHG